MFEAKVQCPRCKKIWTVSHAMPGVECDCHLYCDRGSKPADCSMAEVTAGVQYGWPAGSRRDSREGGDDVVHRRYYCSAHGRYSYKGLIYLEVDWEEWFGKRQPEKFREMQW